ncbi:hypothetical protein Moror_11520 [Moniliophthora roreri MCA 2997]|uniref:Uncharacterized protein n=2 Tax=Moniliophthora roreri TaxID=221103 RepID=V2WQZ6_MONRO|nr:hypothetical protein Moror_11520 [Moniliophthora roreri MCA 2997]KAI3596445.1 hypothetical protein WG66_003231 [Moniliophthora roreri]
MSSPNELPLLTQLTASEQEDPIEPYYLNSLDFKAQTRISLYSLEFFMGLRFGELRLESSLNIVHVRSSIKKLLQEQKLTLLPTEEILDKILELHVHNGKCKLYDRTRYTDVLPFQEYEYRVRPIDLNVPLYIISPDGTRQLYQPLLPQTPHIRSTANPFLVVSNAGFALIKAAFRRHPVPEVKIMEIRHQWRTAPLSFAQKPDWKELGHPLDRLGDPVEEILARKEVEPCPDLVPDTSSSSSYTSLATSMASQHLAWIQNPGTKRWVKKMRKIIDRNIGYEEEVSNDKQIKLYRKEKSRPYEEVMRTSRVHVRFEPYLRPKCALDDISVPL